MEPLAARRLEEVNMSRVRTVVIDGVELFVETEPAEVYVVKRDSKGLPIGSEPVGLQDRIVDAADLIQNSIRALTKTTVAALKEVAPSEYQIEIGMNFKGEANPIPVLVKTGAEASFKVIVKWKNSGG